MSLDLDATVIMEYENFLPFLLPFLPVTNNTDFLSKFDPVMVIHLNGCVSEKL